MNHLEKNLELEREIVFKKVQLTKLLVQKNFKDICYNIVDIATYHNEDRELIVEIGGLSNYLDIIECVKNIYRNIDNIHQIICKSGVYISSVKSKSGFILATHLKDGINQLNKYLKVKKPQRINICFTDYDNTHYPDFVITINMGERPSIYMELSSVVCTTRFVMKGTGDATFNAMTNYYINNISSHR